MELADLKWVLQDYPLDVFVRTPNIITIKQVKLPKNIEEEFKASVKEYLNTLTDLIVNRAVYAKNNVSSVRNWLSKQIEAVNALAKIIRLYENVTNIFEGKINWARALAIDGMSDILNAMARELSILRNQVRGTRFISRIRDRTYFVISQKIPQIFNILATMIAIELGQIACSEIVSAIGKGIVVSEAY